MVLRSSGAILRMAMLRPRALRTARRLIGGIAIPDRTHQPPDRRHHIGHRHRLPRTTRCAPVDRPPRAGRAPGRHGRLYETLRSGRFVLLDPNGASDVDGWADRVEHVQPTGTPGTVTPGTVTLVRPDGYVAWASDEADPARRAAALTSALQAWCGNSADNRVGQEAR
ncbi:MAG: hypothetical protein ACRDQU_13365 [Pseudonocardiaceae bacterium]